MRTRLLGGLVGLAIAAALPSVGLFGQQPPPRERGGAPIRLRNFTFTPTRGQAPAIPPGLQAAPPGAAAYYLVQFEGPVREAWKDAVVAEGAELIEYVPEFAFKVRMNPGEANRVERLAPVVWVGPFHPAYKIAPDLVRGPNRLYDVRLERGANAAAAVAAISATGAQVVSRRGARVTVSADAAQIEAVANVLDVASIDNLLPFVKHNEYGAGVIVGSTLANASGFDGSTQTIGIADTGLGNGTAGNSHAHLPASRIAAIFNWPGAAGGCFETVVNDGAIDVDTGHGTHTATTAVGGGGLAGEGRGAAPAASLVFQAIENYAVPSLLCTLFYGITEGYYLTGIPADLGQLFGQAYSAGARIHSDSWGSNSAGEYTEDSADTDAFVWAHPDMTITFSAGNAGMDFDSDGVVDDGSMNAPATAKNVISVGASENDRQSQWTCDATLTYTNCAAQGGQNDIFTYGATWPGNFPANPLRDDPSAGDREQMAAFSSRGPAVDGRIKPDVVAPGTWMLSGYSDQFQQQYDSSPNPQNGGYQYHGWGNPLNQYYKYMGGTSMANPLVAGASAVVRDFYQKARAHDASAALVKATLINSAVDLLDENNDGVYDNAFPVPNTHEGWGRIDLQGATDTARRFTDNRSGLSTASTASFTYPITGAGWPLRITLVWSDYPSSTAAAQNLVNDLDLRVVAPNGDVYRGNVFAFGASQTGGAADRINNVENVFLQAADAGTWTVDVTGYNVPNGPQPFALVVAGQFEGPDAPSSLLTIAAVAPQAKESGATPGMFRVVRSGSTADALTVNYTIGGSATPGDDYTALPGTLVIGAGDIDGTIDIVPVDDAAIEGDETVVVTLTSDPTYRLGSPAAAVITVISDDVPPDLAVTSVTAPSTGGPGATLSVTYTVRNQGSGPAPASETGLYFSTDVLYDAADVLLATRPTSALAAGQSVSGSADITIPTDVAPGTYYVVAYADAPRAVAETTESNNARVSGGIQIGPDLNVTGITAPTTAGAGQAIAIGDTTRNLGGGPAAPSDTAFYLSLNSVLDAADISLGARAVPELAANLTHQTTTSFTIPAGTAPGTYFVLAVADAGSRVAETNENNNLRVGVQVKIGADLVVTAISAPSSAGAGYPLSINVTTKNQGGGPAPASSTLFYLSLDSTLDASDVLFGTRAIPELVAGASDAGVTVATIPADTATGSYYVIAKADGGASVVETSESNNTKYTPQVRIGPDLVVSSFSGTGTAAAGDSVLVTDTTKNQGAGAAASSHTGFFLSANTTLDAADVRLGDRPVPALAPGAVHTATTSVVIPPATPGGTYYVIPQADVNQEVPEAANVTNVGPIFTIKIGADLRVDGFTVPLAAGAGLPIVVGDTTRNLGYGPAAGSSTGFYLSVNAALDGADLLLGSRQVDPLPASGAHAAQTTLTIPATTATGQYYIIAKADVDRVVSEVSESNNVSYASVRVGPDLTVSALTPPVRAAAGTYAIMNNTTRNSGGGQAGASSTRFYLSVNSTLDAGDVLLGSRAVAALEGGASDTQDTSVLIPPGTAAGTYFVIAKADGDGTVVETQEANNTRVSSFRVDPAVP